jgi:hypothetical protein
VCPQLDKPKNVAGSCYSKATKAVASQDMKTWPCLHDGTCYCIFRGPTEEHSTRNFHSIDKLFRGSHTSLFLLKCSTAIPLIHTVYHFCPVITTTLFGLHIRGFNWHTNTHTRAGVQTQNTWCVRTWRSMCASGKTVMLSEAIFPLSGLHTALRFLRFVPTLNRPTAFLILVTKQATYPLTRGLSSPPFTTQFCSQLVLIFFFFRKASGDRLSI